MRASLPLAALAWALALLLPAAPSRGGVDEGEPRPAAALIRGKVSREGEVTAGARVLAYRSFGDLLAYRAAAASDPTGEDGVYTLELPPGNYYLMARKGGDAEGEGLPAGAFYSYHGSNPFTLPAGSRTEVSFPLARKSGEVEVAAGGDENSGTLTGTVTLGGRAVAGVQVRLYLDAEGDFRGMGYAVAPPTGEDGAFRFDYLPESTYFIIARKRAGGLASGPIREGDHFGYFADNPVLVEGGRRVAVELEMVVKGSDAATADGRPRPGGTVIAGRITDPAGNPVPGTYAFAYREKLMSHSRPAFISDPAGEDGGYVIHLSGGGTFYVGARSAYGDSPGKGEWYGRFEGSADHAVEVAEGDIRRGVDIIVERILAP